MFTFLWAPAQNLDADLKRELQARDLVAGTRSLQRIRVIDLARSDGKNQVKSDPILFDGGEEDLATTGVASGGNEAIINDVGTALLPPIVRCMNPLLSSLWGGVSSHLCSSIQLPCTVGNVVRTDRVVLPYWGQAR